MFLQVDTFQFQGLLSNVTKAKGVVQPWCRVIPPANVAVASLVVTTEEFQQKVESGLLRVGCLPGTQHLFANLE